MKLIANFLYLSGAEVVSKAITFAAVAYLARVAGPVGFGYLEFAAAVMLCAGLIVDQGFDPYGAREIAKAPTKTASLVSEVVVARVFLAIIAYTSVVVFAFLLHRPAIVTQLLLIYGLSLLASPFLLRWVFQGHLKMGTAAVIQMVRQAVYAAVVFAFIHTATQIWIAGLAELAGVIGAVIYGIWMYRRQLGEMIRVRLELSKQLFLEGVPIGLSQLFWMVRMFGATVIVGVIAAPSDVGFFSAAMRIFIALHAFIWLYYFNLLPSMSQSWQKNDGTFSALISNSIRLIAWIGVLVGFVWVLLASMFMVTLYGPAFLQASATLQWLAGVFVIAAINGHYRYGLIASGYQNAEMVVSAIGAGIAVMLIPVGYFLAGTSGAAAGLLAAETVVWLSAWLWSRKRLGLNGHLRLLLWPLTAAGLSLCVARFLPTPSTIVLVLTISMIVIVFAFTCDQYVRNLFRQLIAGFRFWLREIMEKRAQGAAQ